MIATSGLHDSFSRIKKSVCYSSCALERRKFQKMHRIRINSERLRYRGRYLSYSQLFLRLQRGQVSSTFCIRRGMKTVAAHFKITHCITLKCFYYDGCQDWKKQEGAKYVIADTAITAFDSVTWHLQRCHCHKIGLKSFSSTNYYSYVFRRDLVPRSIFITKIIYPIMFAFSYCFTRMFKKRI